MKVLIIGGSYFLGRVFVQLNAAKHDITVVNRGRYSLEEFGVNEIKMDRKDGQAWTKIQGEFDAVIDFCGYDEGDIKTVIENKGFSVKQYIFVSTVDVYNKKIEGANENAEYETDISEDDGGRYIDGKIKLEKELISLCHQNNIEYTILRPAIIYGPYNYAPRESEYIRYMVMEKVLVHITDVPAKYQMVYVKDVAEAIDKSIGNEKVFGKSVNVCGDEIMDYDKLYWALVDSTEDEFNVAEININEAIAGGFPLPFPIYPDESRVCNNELSKQLLQLEYTKIGEGMKKTYNAFRNVFSKN